MATSSLLLPLPPALPQHPGLASPARCLQGDHPRGTPFPWSPSPQGCPCRPPVFPWRLSQSCCRSRSSRTSRWAWAVSGVSREGLGERGCPPRDTELFSLPTCVIFCLIELVNGRTWGKSLNKKLWDLCCGAVRRSVAVQWALETCCRALSLAARRAFPSPDIFCKLISLGHRCVGDSDCSVQGFPKE